MKLLIEIDCFDILDKKSIRRIMFDIIKFCLTSICNDIGHFTYTLYLNIIILCNFNNILSTT